MNYEGPLIRPSFFDYRLGDVMLNSLQTNTLAHLFYMDRDYIMPKHRHYVLLKTSLGNILVLTIAELTKLWKPYTNDYVMKSGDYLCEVEPLKYVVHLSPSRLEIIKTRTDRILSDVKRGGPTLAMELVTQRRLVAGTCEYLVVTSDLKYSKVVVPIEDYMLLFTEDCNIHTYLPYRSSSNKVTFIKLFNYPTLDRLLRKLLNLF